MEHFNTKIDHFGGRNGVNLDFVSLLLEFNIFSLSFLKLETKKIKNKIVFISKLN
jgi:hypothetical protein